ncbi:MAG: tyrosine-type recombinase/integrase [Stackebrandtia sp.]
MTLPPDPLTGKRRRAYQGGFASEEAAWEAAWEAALKSRDEALRGVGRRTLDEFMERWLEAMEGTVKPSTRSSYVYCYRGLVAPRIGRRRLGEIDVPMLNALYRRLRQGGRRGNDANAEMYRCWRARRAAGADAGPRQIAEACQTTIHAARKAVARYRRGRVPARREPGLAPKTVMNVHRLLRRALSDAVAWGWLETSPAERARPPRECLRGKRSKTAAWTFEQLNAWLKVATTDRYAGVWVLAATTGMRRSELAGAARNRLDLDKATLDVGPTRIVVKGEVLDSDGKTESSRRVISLDRTTVAYLRRHLAMLDRERRERGGGGGCGRLLVDSDGESVNPDTLTRRFQHLVDRADVPRIRLHDLRHTYATLSLDAGIHLKTVADRLGHSRPVYTLQTYTHRSTGLDRDAAEEVGEAIFGDDWPAPEDED